MTILPRFQKKSFSCLNNEKFLKHWNRRQIKIYSKPFSPKKIISKENVGGDGDDNAAVQNCEDITHLEDGMYETK